MSIFEAILLGIIQGLTEFLPVSSSGHLVLFHMIFGVEEPTLFFDTMLHVGTLAAVFAVLWQDIWAILRKLVQPLTLYLIIATVPITLCALVFRNQLEDAFETGRFLGVSFLVTSALLITAELLAKRTKNISTDSAAANCLKNPGEMSWRDALVIGAMQAVAVLPGVSRSGATLSGALSRRLDRDFAARFSFLLSIPAILGAVVFQLKDLVKGSAAVEEAAAVTAGGIGVAAIIAGTLSAAIVGFFAVRLMLKIVREKSLWGFAIYTGVLGTLVLVDQVVLGLVY
ncbi:MAG: undecaprenyl-diphosphate phosphatase [Treponema sp.]|nr:undecaprenyl-diphosphate phosphatase [Treponema sp.]